MKGGERGCADFASEALGPQAAMRPKGSIMRNKIMDTVADQRLNERGMGLKEWMDDDGSMGHGPWTLVWSVRPLKLRGSTITGDRIL